MLEEVEVAPGFPLGVEWRTVGRAATGAGEAATGREVDLDVNPASLGVEIAAGHRPWRGQAQRHLHQCGVTHGQSLHAARPERAWRRARHRQGRYAPRKGAVAYGHP